LSSVGADQPDCSPTTRSSTPRTSSTRTQRIAPYLPAAPTTGRSTERRHRTPATAPSPPAPSRHLVT
jgi:hypothetical protein